MVHEAIILAGGRGTRLKGIISNIPKPMSPIDKLPFLSYILSYLAKSEIETVIMSVGYMWKEIYKYYKNSFGDLDIVYSIENELLGTGGGIKKALDLAYSEKVLVLNGDTYFEIDMERMENLHRLHNADITLVAKRVKKAGRYGVLYLENSRVIKFVEKANGNNVLINTGAYFINKDLFKPFSLHSVFSFEKDFLERFISELKIYASVQEGYFIDIGIPEDYIMAGKYFKGFLTVQK